MGSLPPQEDYESHSAAELESENCQCVGGACSLCSVHHGLNNDAQPGLSSFFQATVNSCVLLMGLGTLASSYAIERCGFFGIFVLVITALLFWYGSTLVTKCMEQDKSLMNYQDVACKAFARWGRLLVTSFFYVRILGSLTGFMVSMGDTLAHIFPDFHLSIVKGRTLFTCISFFILLPTVWLRKLSSISYLSFWCVVSILVTIVCLLVAGVKDNIGFDQNVAVFRVQNLPVATGVYTFTLGSTAVFPSVYRSMNDPSRFSKVLVTSFSLATLLNVVVGVIGSLMFGSMTKPLVHLSMPRNLLASKVATWPVLLIPVTQFALILSPVSCELEGRMTKRLPWNKSSRLTCGACLLLRTTLLLVITLWALLFPDFVNIIELLGSSMSVALCVIFPCIFYLKLVYNKLRKWEVAGIAAILVVSALAGIAGTVFCIRDLIHKKHR